MKILIFGGSFNPVHLGHILLAEKFMQKIKPDLFLVIPTNIPVHKNSQEIVDVEHRIKMCRLAFENFSKTDVSDIEAVRSGVSKTIDTIEQLEKIYQDAQFFMIVGSDMLIYMEKWYRFEDILKKVTLCAAVRTKTDKEEFLKCKEKLCQKYSAKVIEANFEPIEISSTQVRKNIKDRSFLYRYIPKKVVEYILKEKLFRE